MLFKYPGGFASKVRNEPEEASDVFGAERNGKPL
jgi:hypothetical protein